MTDLSEIRAAIAAATPGRWLVDGDDYETQVILDEPGPGDVIICSGLHQGHDEGESDAILIANAPTWLAELVERVEAAEAVVNRARSVLWFGEGEGYGHNGHADIEGEPECPGCWVETVRNILGGSE